MRGVAFGLILLGMVIGQSLWQLRQALNGTPVDEKGQQQASAVIVFVLLITVVCALLGI